MKEKPILFNSEMVRAILDGRKTQTRRVIKDVSSDVVSFKHESGNSWKPYFVSFADCNCGLREPQQYPKCWVHKAPYQVGDRLWVRETFVIEDPEFFGYTVDIPTDRPIEYGEPDNTMPLIPHYRATEPEPHIVKAEQTGDSDRTKWESPIYMPKWAARIWLEVTAVRVERLQDIMPEDILAEGAWNEHHSVDEDYSQMYEAWGDLWDSINKKRGLSWQSNPWVWVIEFKRIKI